MKIQKRLFQIGITFCFCIVLGVLSAPAHASSYEYAESIRCPFCGESASLVFVDSTYCSKYSFSCPVCGPNGMNSYDPLAHSWSEIGRKDPTCTSSGYVKYTCEFCNRITRTDDLPAQGHTWIETDFHPADCTSAGSVISVCSLCGETQTEELPALGHTWEETGSIAPTCTDPGSIRRTCSQCGFSVSEQVPALGLAHDWQETSRADATETAAGSIGYTCSVCGSSKSERIPPVGIDLSMSGLLAKITEVLTAALGWVGVVADVTVRYPILLLIVVLGFIGAGVVLFRRFLRL